MKNNTYSKKPLKSEKKNNNVFYYFFVFTNEMQISAYKNILFSAPSKKIKRKSILPSNSGLLIFLSYIWQWKKIKLIENMKTKQYEAFLYLISFLQYLFYSYNQKKLFKYKATPLSVFILSLENIQFSCFTSHKIILWKWVSTFMDGKLHQYLKRFIENVKGQNIQRQGKVKSLQYLLKAI